MVINIYVKPRLQSTCCKVQLCITPSKEGYGDGGTIGTKSSNPAKSYDDGGIISDGGEIWDDNE